MEINGIPVVNGRRRVSFTITPDDVKRGATKSPATCAAARACKRKLNATDVRVHLKRTYIKLGDKWYRFLTPQSLRSEIVAFDRGGRFSPGEYSISPLSPSMRAKYGKRQGGKDRETPSRRRRRRTTRPYHITTDVRARGANK